MRTSVVINVGKPVNSRRYLRLTVEIQHEIWEVSTLPDENDEIACGCYRMFIEYVWWRSKTSPSQVERTVLFLRHLCCCWLIKARTSWVLLENEKNRRARHEEWLSIIVFDFLVVISAELVVRLTLGDGGNCLFVRANIGKRGKQDQQCPKLLYAVIQNITQRHHSARGYMILSTRTILFPGF